MGLRDAEEMLEAAKADAILLERENAQLRAAAQHWRNQVAALLAPPGMRAEEPVVDALTREEARLAAWALRAVRGWPPRVDVVDHAERLDALAKRLEMAS